jgi:hypothetical protein
MTIKERATHGFFLTVNRSSPDYDLKKLLTQYCTDMIVEEELGGYTGLFPSICKANILNKIDRDLHCTKTNDAFFYHVCLSEASRPVLFCLKTKAYRRAENNLFLKLLSIGEWPVLSYSRSANNFLSQVKRHTYQTGAGIHEWIVESDAKIEEGEIWRKPTKGKCIKLYFPIKTQDGKVISLLKCVGKNKWASVLGTQHEINIQNNYSFIEPIFFERRCMAILQEKPKTVVAQNKTFSMPISPHMGNSQNLSIFG